VVSPTRIKRNPISLRYCSMRTLRNKPYLAAAPVLLLFALFFGVAAQNQTSGDDLVTGFKGVTVASVADAVDQLAGKRGFLEHDVRPMIAGQVVGRARTALVKPAPPDKATPELSTKHSVEMIDTSRPGEVGVIVMENGLNVAAIGGLMATAAKARGMAGMVIDGGVRDLAEIRALGLPVYARSVTPATAVSRYASVSRDEPVWCAGVLVHPGDIIVANEDGVVVVPQALAQRVLELSREIDERETRMVPMIEQLKSLGEAIKKFNRI
jgi:4-hydroxy-4-methyl-2-oxoglutarate aldolase